MDGEPCDNPERSRYELRIGRWIARADYERFGDTVTFTHTVVPPALAGQGIASRLIAFALADARAKGLKVVPECSFVRSYIARHPQWQDLLA